MNATNWTIEGPLVKCASALNHSVYSGASIANIIVTTLSALVQVALLIVLHHRRRKLREHIRDQHDLASHLLPLHVGMLRAAAGVYLFQAATLLAPMLGAPLGKLQWEKFPPCITRGVVWGMQHVILDGVAILLCQLGIGKRAIIRTFQIAVPWGFFTAVMTGSSCYYGFTGTDIGRSILVGYYMVQTILYIVFRFGKCAFVRNKRPAFNKYALGWIIFRSIALVTIATAYFGSGNLGKCTEFVLVQVPFIVVVPWMVYSAFRSDTRYWYGCAYRWTDKKQKPQAKDKKLRRTKSDIRQPLRGVQLPSNAVQTTIINRMEALGTDDIISFAETSLNVWAMLGVGAGAKVFKGTCRKRPVAIKLLFAPDIDKENIEKFFNEAAILRFLKHPNIIAHYGVCIAPPALCHVLELCEGSLFELIEKRALMGLNVRTSTGSKSEPLLLSSFVGTEMQAASKEGSKDENSFFFRSVAGQCCSAVAFLHQQTPPIIHQDIKSLNFLYTATPGGRGWQIKLADMDAAVQKEDSQNLPADFEQEMDIWSIVGTPQWSAPECLLPNRSDPPGTKADVFSLAVVWWECLTLKRPFDHMTTRTVVDLVARQGRRLTLPPQTDPCLVELFESAWAHDPRERPTAAEMLLQLHQSN